MIARAARHFIVAPLFCALVLALILISPVTIALAAVASLLFDRSWRPFRFVLFVYAYGVCDVLAVGAGLLLWLRVCGRGSMDSELMQTRHYALISWLLANLTQLAHSLLHVDLEVAGAEADQELRALQRPVIVLSRHAGPGDSFMIVQHLLEKSRRPRIVLRSALQLEPTIDLVGHRLPFCFVSKRHGTGTAACARIAAISSTMDHRAALLLFPEGGNFTANRRMRSIKFLLRSRLRRRARQAADMKNVVAPRPAGVLAALQSAPEASVIFVAHTGLAGMESALWNRIPWKRTLRAHLWLETPGQIPTPDDARIEWLYSWWQRIDAWVSVHDGSTR